MLSFHLFYTDFRFQIISIHQDAYNIVALNKMIFFHLNHDLTKKTLMATFSIFYFSTDLLHVFHF